MGLGILGAQEHPCLTLNTPHCLSVRPHTEAAPPFPTLVKLTNPLVLLQLPPAWLEEVNSSAPLHSAPTFLHSCLPVLSSLHVPPLPLARS